MNESIDYEAYNADKQKRSEKLKCRTDKKAKKQTYDFEQTDEFIGKKKQFKGKPNKSFRNNQKNFEYDYEEDFYEPDKY
ncbi:hypothetical protein FL857_01390 [Criibacterium bergeronii]|uniref:Uncharacterized protein n=1 Tax=Criibacterium bergeronii TaxID=1871336 RepID=A0A552VE70_9FIRM|nr:hypothetical protein [Criibacterium bergeronii]MBS6063370.1 hypothetical protein [Peptostreptococcaceae bacterium]TRW28764.1 hypothetical protein FL857_01390 [Criibacterium bergeronii]